MYLKNTSGQFVTFCMISKTDGTPVTGVTPTCRRCIDGTFAAGCGTVTEDTGLGFYKYAMAQADTNGNNIGFRFIGTGAIDTVVNIVTTSLNPYDAVRAGLTALPNAVAEAAGGLFTRGTGAGQINQDANGRIDVNDVAFGGTAGTFSAGIPEVKVNNIAANAITATSIAADAIGAAELAADAVTEIQSGLASAAALATVAGYIDTEITDIQSRLPAALTAGGNIKADAQVVSDKTGYSLAADARITKNVALVNFCFLMVDGTDFATPKTGLGITAQISKDGGGFSACSNAAAEIASGWYKIALTQAEMNADTVLLRFTGTGAAARNVQILTQPAL